MSQFVPAARLDGIEISLIRQINALATPLSINLGIGEPNVEPDATLREMAARAATTSWRYSPNAGTSSLRQKLGERYAYDPKSEVCVTAGTEQGLFAIFQAYVNPGDEVLIPDPGFVVYGTLARMCGAVAVPYPVEPHDWQLEADAVTSRITSRTKLIIVNSPSNPLGSVVSAEVLATIAAAGVLVVSDEVYGEIWYEHAPPSMAHLGQNVLVLSGMSKSHSMTGLRLGWILADADVMRPIVTAHQYVATCASVFSQALAEAILSDEKWNQSWLTAIRAQFREQRDVALDAVARELEVVIPMPGGAFYAFVPVPFCESLAFARAAATEAAVLVIPGVAFGKRGEGFVRISYASPAPQIVAGVERLGRYLRSVGR